ncbi:hypothetical protein [Flavobacterium polysaccharolyticum]|uniref:Uncharacterized protein n=1 Tax=Flavobacterium polysaccharolyticum TaxID=3133148 RepID=A0ABU9NLS0_9FLAO
MKKHYQKYCMHLACTIISTSSFLFTTRVSAQEKLAITPEMTKQIVEKYKIEPFKIYPVVTKKIEYYSYVDGEIATNEYKNELRKLEQYKPAFDEYNNALKANLEKEQAIKTISQNIDTFLSSNEKYDVKERLLIDSQTLADKYDIKVEVVDDRMKLSSFINTPTAGFQKQSMRFIHLYEKGKRANKTDLRAFKTEIQKIKISEPEITNNYRWYLDSQKELSTIQKTETGKILSDKLSKKLVYLIEENSVDVTALSGDFTKLPDNYMLVDKEVANTFIKNELITEKHDNYTKLRGSFDRFPIIKKLDTDEMFYVMSDKFIGQLEIVLNEIKFKNLGNTDEYKTWKSKYLSLLQSAQTNVNSCNAIIKKYTYLNRIGQKRYDSDKFSKQEKGSFNQNLDSLKAKLEKIRVLESERDNLSFYNEKASDAEAVKSYSISNFYNSTSRCY